MDFNTKLKEQRKKHKLSQEKLADQLHIARQSVSKWERGEGYPSIGVLLRLSELFDVPVDDLLKGDEYLRDKIIRDSENLKYPRLKSFFEWVFMTGLVVLLIKIIVGALAYFDVVDWQGTILRGWLAGIIPIALMLIGGATAEELGKIKQK